MANSLFEEWRAYEKLVEQNYMSHVEFFRRLEEELNRRFRGPVAILDLGCGDASPIRDILRRIGVERYCGVDDSPAALAMAEEKLKPLKIPCRFISGDLLVTLQSLTESYDVIVASYSLHHIVTLATKELALRECRRVLKSGGLLFLIDVFLREGETRQAYLRRWERNARAAFTELDEGEMATVIDHVWTCDFPESLSAYQESGARAGYERVVSLAEDSLNRLVALDTMPERR
jgi:ubiquinone/menaquinone biosynthesis C-methylase UbiE